MGEGIGALGVGGTLAGEALGCFNSGSLMAGFFLLQKAKWNQGESQSNE
jgi:hypothetical protein